MSEKEERVLAEDPKCAICLEDCDNDAAAMMPCMDKHRLHASCLMRNWGAGNQVGDDMKCPLCFVSFRRVILERFIEDGVVTNEEITYVFYDAMRKMLTDNVGATMNNLFGLNLLNAGMLMFVIFYLVTHLQDGRQSS